MADVGSADRAARRPSTSQRRITSDHAWPDRSRGAGRQRCAQRIAETCQRCFWFWKKRPGLQKIGSVNCPRASHVCSARPARRNTVWATHAKHTERSIVVRSARQMLVRHRLGFCSVRRIDLGACRGSGSRRLGPGRNTLDGMIWNSWSPNGL